MAFKVCIAWAISAVALLVSSALASPTHKGPSGQIFPGTNVAAEEGADAGASEEEHKEEEAEEIED
ncbi:MAG: hypothetical protein K2Q34_02570 [Alphaproteobacteria bacterium]|nr:hypothetical protein [Alphaproteobacteria bacterium]